PGGPDAIQQCGIICKVFRKANDDQLEIPCHDLDHYVNNEDDDNKRQGCQQPFRQAAVPEPHPSSVVPERVDEIPDHPGKYQRLKERREIDKAHHDQRNDEQPRGSSFDPDLADIEFGACHRYNFSKYNGFDVYFWHKAFPPECRNLILNVSMKHTRTLYLFALGLATILYSCQQRSTEQSESVAEEAGFKPNPQKVPEHEVRTLEPGDQAPDFNLPDVSGRFYSLADFADASVLVIIFTCNHCPTAQAYEDRMIQFTEEYRDKGVAVVGIMPNSTLALLPEEC